MFRKKRSVADVFYADIQKGQMGLYQKYFDALVSVMDIDNYTLWTRSNDYDRSKLDRDNRVLERVCFEEIRPRDLSPEYLRCMIYQYIFAEPWLREDYRSTWVRTVVYNEGKLVFLPEARRVRRFLEVKS